MANYVLSINSGSSSLKFKMFEMPTEEVVTSGIIEKIGLETSIFTTKFNGEKYVVHEPIPDHSKAVELLLATFVKLGLVDNVEDIKGVGHRIVHGGELYKESVLIDDDVLEGMASLSHLAPLHNPVNIIGVRSFQEFIPNAKHVAIFDTAFHQTMDASNYLYPIPYEYYEQYRIRRYGFHGTSHFFVTNKVAQLMNRSVEDMNIISAHLGNGASITAIRNGKSINTSMGFTPLAGIMMGTRSGDVDPAILPFIMDAENLSASEVLKIFNNKSGMYGVSGISSDARDIIAAKNEGNARAALTLELYTNRVAEVIGSYFVKLGRIDAIVFTGGIGENAVAIRQMILEKIEEAMRLNIDYDLNNKTMGEDVLISTEDSNSQVWVVPTDEELVIARDTYGFIKG